MPYGYVAITVKLYIQCDDIAHKLRQPRTQNVVVIIFNYDRFLVRATRRLMTLITYFQTVFDVFFEIPSPLRDLYKCYYHSCFNQSRPYSFLYPLIVTNHYQLSRKKGRKKTIKKFIYSFAVIMNHTENESSRWNTAFYTSIRWTVAIVCPLSIEMCGHDHGNSMCQSCLFLWVISTVEHSCDNYFVRNETHKYLAHPFEQMTIFPCLCLSFCSYFFLKKILMNFSSVSISRLVVLN